MVVVAAVADNNVIGVDDDGSIIVIETLMVGLFDFLFLFEIISPPEPLCSSPYPNVEKLRAGPVRQGCLIAGVSSCF